MDKSILLSAIGFCLLTGCGSVVQLGLANAPSLGGASPETRVHDVVANGPNSCERSPFPPGEVLRGQIPPCRIESFATRAALLPPVQPAGLPLDPSYSFGSCTADRQSLMLTAEKSMTGFTPSTRPPWVICDLSSSVSP